jgi:drug/metabolite transporter (DMT)-like permease
VTILYALVSSLIYGCSDFIGGATSRAAPPLWVAAFGQVVSIAFVVPIALIAASEEVTGTDIGWSLASGFAGAIGLGLFYSAMGRGQISLVVPLTAVIAATFPITYGLAHGERPGTIALTGIILALVAIVIVSMLPGEGQPVSADIVATCVVAGVLFGGFIIGLSRTSEDAGMWPAALSRLSCAAGLLLLAPVVTGKLAGMRRALPACLAIGVCEAAGMVTFLLALQRGPVSVTSVLISLYPVTTILLAVGLLGERPSRLQLVGVALAVGAVLLISAP